MVRFLLDRGADPNTKDERGATALWMVAARTGLMPNRTALAELLLQRGADPNVVGMSPGGTVLSWAAAKAEPDLVRLLLRNGAQVNQRDSSGGTALQAALQRLHAHKIGVAALRIAIAKNVPEQRTESRKRLQAEQSRLRDAETTVQILKQAGATK
jgi:ankyrin repeat protein